MELQPVLKIGRDNLPPGDVLCNHCVALCCRYFALPLETPDNAKDYDHMRWYLMHGETSIFTEGSTWYLVVHTRCENLSAANRCLVYEKRPQICRSYSENDCEFDNEYYYDRYFESADQVQEYAEAMAAHRGRVKRSSMPPLLPILST